MTDVDVALKELEAMKKVAESLKGLEEGSIRRVLSWAGDHFSVKIAPPSSPSVKNSEVSNENLERDIISYGDAAELFEEAQPETDADKALVVSYWMQYFENCNDVDSQSVNSKLKHMGHGIGNVTRAFENLKRTKPQLVIQLQKAGTSKQARKTYKVTTAGKNYVDNMLKNGG